MKNAREIAKIESVKHLKELKVEKEYLEKFEKENIPCVYRYGWGTEIDLNPQGENAEHRMFTEKIKMLEEKGCFVYGVVPFCTYGMYIHAFLYESAVEPNPLYKLDGTEETYEVLAYCVDADNPEEGEFGYIGIEPNGDGGLVRVF